VGDGPNGHTAIARHFDPKRHRRVVLFTDRAQHDAGRVQLDRVPSLYTCHLAGAAPSARSGGQRGRYTLPGFTDASFAALTALEAGRADAWPF
jgi:hypothetical protein